MLNWLRKRTHLERLIVEHGLEQVTEQFAEIIGRKLPDRHSARAFILEELGIASNGNATLKGFAANSGISAAAIEGALRLENQVPDEPRQLLLELSFQLMGNEALMTEFRCSVNDKIMRRFALGKYSDARDSWSSFAGRT